MNKAKLLKKTLKAQDKAWNERIKKLDQHRCVYCGAKKMLNAHHIIPRNNKKFRWDLDNGITLCPKHHRFSFEFSAHQNPFAFYLWLQEKRGFQFSILKNKFNS